MEERERKRTGIGSLKIRYNQVFGYYIEVSKAESCIWRQRDYERKQTLVNAERFTSDELKEHERKVLTGRRARRSKSSGGCMAKSANRLRAKQGGCGARPAAIAQLDVLVNFARYRGGAELYAARVHRKCDGSGKRTTA